MLLSFIIMAPMTTLTGKPFSRAHFESLLKRRLFYTESFEVYRTAPNFKGDNRGLFDYGPPGCALLANIVNEWRKHFIIEENMLEVDLPALTPEAVLQTSGHVDKFADWMCKDLAKGDYLRADHLIEGVLQTRLNTRTVPAVNGKGKAEKLDDVTAMEYEAILAKIDNYSGPELGQLIKKYKIRNPNGNGEVQDPIAFNLMFRSTIGPSAASPVYLRPETAQGQFLNFRKLLDYCQGSMPFASACIGKSYRNEISPRSGLLRVREFLMAEIEHYVDPSSNKSHQRFSEIAQIELPFLDKDTQLSGKTTVQIMTVDKAVQQRLVDNETLGYFLARIYLFLLKLGADKTKLRFRQHLANEMAHYATDCWDAELLTSYGWIECVGCADRSAYDLTVHSKATGTPLVVKETLPEPLEVIEWQATLQKKLVGPKFKKDAKKIEMAVASLDQVVLEALAAELEEKAVITIPTEALTDGSTSVQLTSDICSINQVIRLETTREYTPNVIEPSFGIGRILYSILEQVHWSRPQDDARQVLSLPVLVAPTKVLLAPLSNNPGFRPTVQKLAARFRSLGISNIIDSSGVSIGKRYARNDELGTPLGITVDFKSLDDGSITLRERDSTTQIRASEDEVVDAATKLITGAETWKQVYKRLPVFTGHPQDE
ncbi:Glycine--tRNA ligase-like protein [Paramyrothecium foliicola]|nr:Glycine--tRNA ligase-like protein [Paramyrothecium foliicola]